MQAPDPAVGQWRKSSFDDLKRFKVRGQKSRDTILQAWVMLPEMTWLGQHPRKKKVYIRATLRGAEMATGHLSVRTEDSELRDRGGGWDLSPLVLIAA